MSNVLSFPRPRPTPEDSRTVFRRACLGFLAAMEDQVRAGTIPDYLAQAVFIDVENVLHRMGRSS